MHNQEFDINKLNRTISQEQDSQTKTEITTKPPHKSWLYLKLKKNNGMEISILKIEKIRVLGHALAS